MKTTEYKIQVIPFGTLKDQQEGTIYVSQEEGIDKCVNFICPCGCGLQTYFPFGESNHEGGSGEPRSMQWHVKGEILSISPSIEVVGGCKSHYHIKYNKVV